MFEWTQISKTSDILSVSVVESRCAVQCCSNHSQPADLFGPQFCFYYYFCFCLPLPTSLYFWLLFYTLKIRLQEAVFSYYKTCLTWRIFYALEVGGVHIFNTESSLLNLTVRPLQVYKFRIPNTEGKMSSSTLVAVRKHHKLGDFNHKDLFLSSRD